MSFVKYVQSLAWFLSHSSWDEFLCFAACLWLRCIGWPRFTPQSVQVLKLEAPITVFRLSPGVGSLPVVAPCVWRMGCHPRGLRSITVISCPVSTDGPDYVSLWTQPGVFDAVLTAVTGASVQSECACFSRPEPTHVPLDPSWLPPSVSEESRSLLSLAWEQMGNYGVLWRTRRPSWPPTGSHHPAAS